MMASSAHLAFAIKLVNPHDWITMWKSLKKEEKVQRKMIVLIETSKHNQNLSLDRYLLSYSRACPKMIICFQIISKCKDLKS